MKKYLLSLVAVCVCAIMGYAETVTFDFTKENAYGITAPENVSSGTDLEANQVITEGAVSMEAVFAADASTKIRIWRTNNGVELRAYTGQSLKFTCDQEITNIEFTGGKTSKITLGNMPAKEVTAEFGATVNISTIAVTYGEAPSGPVTLFESTFDKDSGIGLFNVDNIVLPEGFTSVWNADSYGYMKASAYSGGSLASDGWLISPVFDLKDVKAMSLSFDHCINKFPSVETAKEQVSVAVRVDGGDWNTLEIPEWSQNNGWTFVNSGAIDMTSYLGKKVEIGFHYTSTTEASGTWEVKNFKLAGEGTIAVEEPVAKPTEVANIAAFLADKSAGVTFKFTNSVNVTYQNGQRLYVEDATGSLLIYGNVGQTYVTGNVIPAGFTGVYAEYGKAPQLGSPEGFEAASTSVELAPEELAVEELATDMVSKYVKLVGVTITAVSGKNYTMEQDGEEVALYDQFNITPATGENLTVIGIYTTYNGTPQVQPIEVTNESGVVIEKVANPVFSPAAGAVFAGTKVEITTSTEGASIHYTTDGSEPTEASALYSEPIEIAEAVTLKAIAVKEGFEASEVVVAEFTIREPGLYKGEFDTFNGGEPKTTYGTYTNATGWTAENSAILCGNEEGATDNNPKYSFIGDPTTLAVCMNGKTTAVGKITSPVLTGGIKDLTFKYGLPFADTKIDFTVTVYGTDGEVVATEKVAPESVEKGVAYDFSMEVNYSDDFRIEIMNNSPSESTSNKDRTAIWNLTWNAYSSAIATAEVVTDAPAEFFNLQGVRVVNPESGIFIRRQGNKVEKVVIR